MGFFPSAWTDVKNIGFSKGHWKFVYNMQTPPKTNEIDRRVVRIMSRLIKLIPTTQIMQMSMYLTHSPNEHATFFPRSYMCSLFVVIQSAMKWRIYFILLPFVFKSVRGAGVLVSIRGNKGIQIIRQSIPFHLSAEFYSMFVVDAHASNKIISSLFIAMIRAIRNAICSPSPVHRTELKRMKFMIYWHRFGVSVSVCFTEAP